MVRLADPDAGTAGVTIHKTRRLTVNEVIGLGGPLEVLVNNTLYDGSKRANYYSDFAPVTTKWNTSFYSELPHEGETELWEIVNLTADAHPMHPHLVAFQVVNRQPLDVLTYTAAYNALYPVGMPIDGNGPPLDYACGVRWPNPTTPITTDVWAVPPRGPVDCALGGNPDPVAVGAALAGDIIPPMPQERGWKDTVQVLPNMITRVLVRFAKTNLPAGTPANAVNAGYDFSPNSGHGYVWHCHIVDHEDNEMMRPYSVFDNPAVTHTYKPGQY
jgi:FtsP/CotA-like multicopper oxidase with cupredoxin domain